MIEEEQVEVYLESVVRQRNLQDAHVVIMKFMCRCLSLVKGGVPEVGKDALDVAENFWFEGKGEEKDILAARVACWSYLDAKHHDVDIEGREDAAMRAVICVLYEKAESKDFLAETLRWFVSMLDRLGDYSVEVSRAMKEGSP